MTGDDRIQVWVTGSQSSIYQIYDNISHNNTITSIILHKVKTK